MVTLLCDPSSELRLGGREKRRAKITTGMETKECMKNTTIEYSVKHENRADIYCGSEKQEIREPFVGK